MTSCRIMITSWTRPLAGPLKGARGMPLTPKQAQFVDEYLIDLNATQAAIRAGYAEASANREGYRLLTNADIQAAIAEAQAERQKRVKFDQDEIVRRLWRRANLDMGLLMEWGGGIEGEDDGRFVRIKDSADLPRWLRGSIDSVKSHKDGGVEVKLFPKVKAEELLMRHFGMLNDRVDVTTGGQALISAKDEEEIGAMSDEELIAGIEDLSE